MKELLFMSGLPRSGSTLLSTLLSQNPEIHTEPSSPLEEIISGIGFNLEKSEQYRAYPKPESLKEVLKGVIQSYYFHTTKPTVIDKNRGWPAKIFGMEHFIVERAKIICPVRDIRDILASFLKLAWENPHDTLNGKANFIDRALIFQNRPLDDQNRCEFLLSEKGLLGKCIRALQIAISGGYKDRLHFVEYRDLVSNPMRTLEKVYEFIGKESYNGHQFDSIIRSTKELDAETFGVPNLHSVGAKLKMSDTNAKTLLPQKYYEGLNKSEFWRFVSYSDYKGALNRIEKLSPDLFGISNIMLTDTHNL